MEAPVESKKYRALNRPCKCQRLRKESIKGVLTRLSVRRGHQRNQARCGCIGKLIKAVACADRRQASGLIIGARNARAVGPDRAGNLMIPVVIETCRCASAQHRGRCVARALINSIEAEEMSRPSWWGYCRNVAVLIVCQRQHAVIGERLRRRTPVGVVAEADRTAKGIFDMRYSIPVVVCVTRSPRPLRDLRETSARVARIRQRRDPGNCRRGRASFAVKGAERT